VKDLPTIGSNGRERKRWSKSINGEPNNSRGRCLWLGRSVRLIPPADRENHAKNRRVEIKVDSSPSSMSQKPRRSCRCSPCGRQNPNPPLVSLLLSLLCIACGSRRLALFAHPGQPKVGSERPRVAQPVRDVLSIPHLHTPSGSPGPHCAIIVCHFATRGSRLGLAGALVVCRSACSAVVSPPPLAERVSRLRLTIFWTQQTSLWRP